MKLARCDQKATHITPSTRSMTIKARAILHCDLAEAGQSAP
jgi:hypothetical protein